MKKIWLSGKHGKDKFALVDDEDFERINKFRWHLGTWSYALNTNQGSMQEFILGKKKSLIIDHVNHNRLDNRKENLRYCTKTENNRNIPKHKNTSSKYKGVYFYKRINKWHARINEKHIGFFKSELHAAMAYDLWAKEIHGKFAWLNFK